MNELLGKTQLPITGLLYSQIGYDLGQPMQALVRCAEGDLSVGTSFRVLHAGTGAEAISGILQSWGNIWHSCWWIADFTSITDAGEYLLIITAGIRELFRSSPFRIGHELLWNETVAAVGVVQAERRSRFAMNKVGWQDCGGAWQEANSHAAYIAGFCDVLEHTGHRLDAAMRRRVEAQIINGCDYLALLQDRALALGYARGAVCHQTPTLEEPVLIGDVSKAALAFARAATQIDDGKKAEDYRQRAAWSLEWLRSAEPLGNVGFQPRAHGASSDFIAPKEWMTRDLLMAMWATLELAQHGDEAYQNECCDYAARILRRQVPRERAEGPYYGHFYLFDSTDITEKAWSHNMENRVLGVDNGATYPHYLLPLLQMCRVWPEHADRPDWERALRDFAYGYFLPACSANPFHLLPLGYYAGEGLLSFSGLWHGMNAVYPLAAVLALAFERHFHDSAFRPVAMGNLQWLAGVNAGITETSLQGAFCWDMPIPPDVALPCSLINGVGARSAGSWLNVRGAICNGFSVGKQFIIDVGANAATDAPSSFTDEDWITHAGGWLSGMAYLYADIKVGLSLNPKFC